MEGLLFESAGAPGRLGRGCRCVLLGCAASDVKPAGRSLPSTAKRLAGLPPLTDAFLSRAKRDGRVDSIR
jgi:hypothetical protein